MQLMTVAGKSSSTDSARRQYLFRMTTTFWKEKDLPYTKQILANRVLSQQVSLKGEQAGFDFGEEGDKLVEIVTDPMQFNLQRKRETLTGTFLGKDFLVNIDDGDQPVSIDIRRET